MTLYEKSLIALSISGLVLFVFYFGHIGCDDHYDEVHPIDLPEDEGAIALSVRTVPVGIDAF